MRDILYGLFIILLFIGCGGGSNSAEEGRTITVDSDSNQSLLIRTLSKNLNLTDGKSYIVEKSISKATGSIYLSGETTLTIRANITFLLNEDLEFGIYLSDNAKVIIENSTLSSNGKMWEFELRNNSSISVTNAKLLNHSAVKLFDKSRLDGKSSLISLGKFPVPLGRNDMIK